MQSANANLVAALDAIDLVTENVTTNVLGVIVRALVVWVGMLLIAIANGTFRVGVLELRMVEAAAM